MKWIKHMTDASDRENTAALLEEFGPLGYGIWWLLLEGIGKIMDESDKTFARFPLKKWTKICCTTPKTLEKIIKFQEKCGNISVKREGKYLEIDCPSLASIRDEYTAKRARGKDKTPDKIRTNSGECPEQEVEVEVEVEVEKDTTTIQGIEDDKHLKPEEKTIFKKLATLPNYPFDLKRDKQYIFSKHKDYPGVDIWAELDKWIDHKQKVKPLEEGCNARGSITTWLGKARDRAEREKLKPYLKELDERFDTFFAGWPNQSGMGEARKLWYKAFPYNMDNEKKNMRLRNAEKHRDIHLKGRDPQYVKGMDNFIRTLDFDHPPIGR